LSVLKQIQHDSEVEKRLYWMDAEVLREVSNGHLYTRDISMRLNRSRRCVNKHLSKLIRWGWIQRVGSVRCPFQWYDVDYSLEVSRARILDSIMEMWRQNPERAYFVMGFLSATVPSSYVWGRLWSPGRSGGRSVPFGTHLPVSRHVCSGVFLVPLGEVGEFTEDSLLQDVFDDFSREDVPFTFPDEFDEREEPFGDEDEFWDEDA
jgi:hypothetical protein